MEARSLHSRGEGRRPSLRDRATVLLARSIRRPAESSRRGAAHALPARFHRAPLAVRPASRQAGNSNRKRSTAARGGPGPTGWAAAWKEMAKATPSHFSVVRLAPPNAAAFKPGCQREGIRLQRWGGALISRSCHRSCHHGHRPSPTVSPAPNRTSFEKPSAKGPDTRALLGTPNDAQAPRLPSRSTLTWAEGTHEEHHRRPQ